jgi:hypothetical protein
LLYPVELRPRRCKSLYHAGLRLRLFLLALFRCKVVASFEMFAQRVHCRDLRLSGVQPERIGWRLFRRMLVCRICLPLDVQNNSPQVRVPMNCYDRRKQKNRSRNHPS